MSILNLVFFYQFESFKNPRNEIIVFCNFGIFKINSNLSVREHFLLQSFSVIFIERTKVEIIENKERNHFGIFCRLNEYQEIIKDVYEEAMTSHKDRDSTYSKISECFVWYPIYKDIESYTKW